jgi:hypothetical protein
MRQEKRAGSESGPLHPQLVQSTMTDERDMKPHTESLRALPDDDASLAPLMSLRRRTIIRYVGRLSPSATAEVSELARVCAAVERDLPIYKVNHRLYRQTYQSMRRRDITKLSDAGILDEHADEVVSRGKRFTEYIALLDAIDTHLS